MIPIKTTEQPLTMSDDNDYQLFLEREKLERERQAQERRKKKTEKSSSKTKTKKVLKAEKPDSWGSDSETKKAEKVKKVKKVKKAETKEETVVKPKKKKSTVSVSSESIVQTKVSIESSTVTISCEDKYTTVLTIDAGNDSDSSSNFEDDDREYLVNKKSVTNQFALLCDPKVETFTRYDDTMFDPMMSDQRFDYNHHRLDNITDLETLLKIEQKTISGLIQCGSETKFDPTKTRLSQQQCVSCLTSEEQHLFDEFKPFLPNSVDKTVFKDEWCDKVLKWIEKGSGKSNPKKKGKESKANIDHKRIVNTVKAQLTSSKKAEQKSLKLKIQAKVCANLDNKSIEHDIRILDSIRGQDKLLNKLGEKTKKLNDQTKILDALLQVWKTFDVTDMTDQRKHIFIRIREIIGDQGINEMSGSIGRSLKDFFKKFNGRDLIDFCFQKENDIMVQNPLPKVEFKLSEFQSEFMDYFDNGYSVVISAPTSSGKTICATYCIQYDKKVLMLYPTCELARQAAGTISKMQNEAGQNIPIIYIDGHKSVFQENAKVVIGTPDNIYQYFLLEDKSHLSVNDTPITGEYIKDNFMNFGTPLSDHYRSHRGLKFQDFDVLVVDEVQQINMMGSIQAECIQKIMMQCYASQMVVLSATIRNITEVADWIRYLKWSKTTGPPQVKEIVYGERFLNQTRHVYTGGNVEQVSCLSVLETDMIKDGVLNSAEMQFPPNQLPTLGSVVSEKTSDPSINPYQYFEHGPITLERCKQYENKLKSVMTDMAQTEEGQDSIREILDMYNVPPVNLESLDIPDLYKILIHAKKNKMLRAMCFIFDQKKCKETCFKLLRYMQTEEKRWWPHWYIFKTMQEEAFTELRKTLEKEEKKTFSVESGTSQRDATEANVETIADEAFIAFQNNIKNMIEHIISQLESNPTEDSEQLIKNYMSEWRKFDAMRSLTSVNVYAPHPDYTFHSGIIDENDVRSLRNSLRDNETQGKGRRKRTVKPKHTNEVKCSIDYKDPYMLCAERGFTFYTDTLRSSDERFQGTAQTMMEKYGIQLMFTDACYAYGVNLPIRLVLFYNPMYNEIGMEKLSVILAHQAQGRGARRGLDTEGHIIYAGVEHKQLMLGQYLNITGHDILKRYDSLPAFFNGAFEIKRLAKMSMSQFHASNQIDDPEERRAFIMEQQNNNIRFLKEDLSFWSENNIWSPMCMFMLSRICDKCENLIELFSYLTQKYAGQGLDFKQYDLIYMISCVLFPDIDDHETQTGKNKIETNMDIVFTEYKARCLRLNKPFQFGNYMELAEKIRRNDLTNFSETKLLHLRKIKDVMRLLYCLTGRVTSTWREPLLKSYQQISNVIFKLAFNEFDRDLSQETIIRQISEETTTSKYSGLESDEEYDEEDEEDNIDEEVI